MTVLKHVDFEVPGWGELASGPVDSPSFESFVTSLSPDHWYRMSETGTTLTDHAGTVDGTWNATPTLVDGLVAYDSNQATDNQGTNYAVLGTATDLDYDPASDALTIFMVFSASTLSAFQRLLSKIATGTLNQYEIVPNTTNMVFSSGGMFLVASHSGLYDGQPHTLATRWFDDGGTQTFAAYIDGVSIGQKTGMASNTGGWPVSVGKYSATSGSITDAVFDELIFFESNLTEAQVAELHRRAVGGLQP